MNGSAGSAWPTATGKDADGARSFAQDGTTRIRANAGQTLVDIATWTSPSATDSNRGGKITPAMSGTTLTQQVNTVWPTPAARDHKGENGADHLTNGTGRLHMDQLPNAVAFLYSRPDLPTQSHGQPSSNSRLTWRRLRRLVIASHGRAVWKRMAANGGKRRLNPNFVEWLMGFPTGHSLCACSATGFFLWQQQMRGALSRLPMASGPWIWKPPADAPPAPKQLDLWGEP